MTKPNQASVHDISFRFWDKEPERNITDEKISKTLFWLLDAINTGKLEAWHNAQRVNEIQGFVADTNNTDEVFINFLAMRKFIDATIYESFEEQPVFAGYTWKECKEKLFSPIGGIGDPQKDFILYLEILPDFIKHELLNQYVVHKNKKTTEQDKTKVFPCKPGTRWKDITITLTSNDAVTIKTLNRSRRYHFSELGMKDGRSGDKPTDLWTLLGVFCRYSGQIDSENQIHGFHNLSKSISDLNKKLQNVSEIDERFCHKYNKREGWVAKCIFNDNTFSE